jgi:hypothetical protein
MNSNRRIGPTRKNAPTTAKNVIILTPLIVNLQCTNLWALYCCTWSDYHDAYVYDADIEYCSVEGVVHDQEELVFAQGREVLVEHVEEHPVHGLILTEHAADCLGEKYLGNDDEEEVEEAA